MKLYNKLYILAESKKEIEYYMDNMGDNVGLKELSNRFILSEDELWEMWCNCAVSQVDKETKENNEIAFKEFLQSKGITL